MTIPKKRGLGRGLSELLGDVVAPQATAEKEDGIHADPRNKDIRLA